MHVLMHKMESDLHSTSSTTGRRSDGYSMYEAILEGNWPGAEKLLQRSPSLALDEITRRGDRALHVAAATGQERFVRELAERVSSSDLAILDGRGCTACCYAAISGKVEIADLMVKWNPNLVTTRDKNNETPLHKAALCGNKEMVSHLLRYAKAQDFSPEEWFGVLVLVVQAKMYDVALELLGKDGSLATMRNEEGTALHILARHDISHFRVRGKILDSRRIKRSAIPSRRFFEGVMPPNLRLLAEKLWAEVQRSRRDRVRELMQNPPILHDAARVGNVELITMLTKTYPNLMWERDERGHTIFHVAAVFRRENVFRLIHTRGVMRHFVATSRDENGENILHLAAKLAPSDRKNVVSVPALHMQKELLWFKPFGIFSIAKVCDIFYCLNRMMTCSKFKGLDYKEVEAIVPPQCRETRNKDGQTPRELFSKEHKSLLEKSENWMRNTADSCMLIATIMLTVVFTAAFTVPGGNNQDTGIPILLHNTWFTCFVIFEALALFGSTLSILVFWSIMTSSFEENQFRHTLPRLMKVGLVGMMVSLVGSLSAFMSAYFLVFVSVRGWLVKMVIIHVYIGILMVIVIEVVKLCLNANLQRYFSEAASGASLENMIRSLVRRLK